MSKYDLKQTSSILPTIQIYLEDETETGLVIFRTNFKTLASILELSSHTVLETGLERMSCGIGSFDTDVQGWSFSNREGEQWEDDDEDGFEALHVRRIKFIHEQFDILLDPRHEVDQKQVTSLLQAILYHILNNLQSILELEGVFLKFSTYEIASKVHRDTFQCRNMWEWVGRNCNFSRVKQNL
jgi:hypothetical protein